MSTFAELKSNVSKELGLDETASGDEDVLLGRRLNQAVVQVLLETHCYIFSTTFALIADTFSYNLQDGASNLLILDIHRLTDTNNIPLKRISTDEFFEFRRASATATFGQRFYALDGSNLLLIWPTPSAAETLTLYSVPRPTLLTTAGHDPSDKTYGGIPAEHHEAIEFYAKWKMASYDDDGTSNQGDRYFGLYQAWLAKIKKAQKLKGGQRLPKANLGRRQLLASDPSRT